jgi:hypothetical protein
VEIRKHTAAAMSRSISQVMRVVQEADSYSATNWSTNQSQVSAVSGQLCGIFRLNVTSHI